MTELGSLAGMVGDCQWCVGAEDSGIEQGPSQAAVGPDAVAVGSGALVD